MFIILIPTQNMSFSSPLLYPKILTFNVPSSSSTKLVPILSILTLHMWATCCQQYLLMCQNPVRTYFVLYCVWKNVACVCVYIYIYIYISQFLFESTKETFNHFYFIFMPTFNQFRYKTKDIFLGLNLFIPW